MELPHTAGCLVCGRDNPHGLHLSSIVDSDTGEICTNFSPGTHHIGFDGVIHGGILATVADEIMVWASIWVCGRACLAAELSLRFRSKAAVGRPLRAVAKVTHHRSRLIETSAQLHDGRTLICTAAGKYIPLGPDDTIAFLKTLVNDSATAECAQILRNRFDAADQL
jgi:acyl-coenzyme A thioesterase PaaI-like protein